MSYNCPEFIKEFAEQVKRLGASSVLEVGSLSCELKDAVGADGIDIAPRRNDVVKADILEYAPEKPYDLVFSSGLLEHYAVPKAIDIIKAMAACSSRYVLNYVPNSGCKAYMQAKLKTNASWRNELDYTELSLAELHRCAGLDVAATGTAAAQWAKRFGREPSEPYLVWVLAQKHVPITEESPKKRRGRKRKDIMEPEIATHFDAQWVGKTD